MDQGPGRGDRLGRFELGEELGAGGMGTVFRARDVELGREVAVKVLRPEVTSPEARVRITREAQAMARLAHPNVVRVHELGDDDAGVYLVMELVEGQSLTAWLAEKPRAVGEVIDVFLAAATGLEAAHAAGLVHRDFKPENVLVDRRGKVRVTDFGLVCVSGERADVQREAELDLLSLALTQTGAVVGTPRYMAPEQFLARAVDARTDQFSFCVALYRALYGEPPFAGTKYGELMDDVIEGRVRAARADSAVPADVRAVVVRGLAADPAQRFASMRELAAALRATSRPPPRRRRRVFAAAALAVVALAGGAVAAMGSRSTRTTTATAAATPARACATCARLVDVSSGKVIAERVIDAVAGPGGQLAWTEVRGTTQVIVIEGGGGRRDLLAAELIPSQPAFSPDGYQVAFASAKRGLFVTQSPSATPERLTDGEDSDPAWLDASRIVFTRLEQGRPHALVVRVDATAPPTPLVDGNVRVRDSRDGRVLLDDGRRLYVWKDGRDEPLAAPVGWRSARFAGDGRDVVVTTATAMWRVGPTREKLHEVTDGTLVGGAITSDGRVVAAVR